MLVKKRKHCAHLFSSEPASVQQQLLLDDVAMYSVTECTAADEMTSILHALPGAHIITDGTACVGGNAMSFAKTFKHVNAIEINATRHAMLVHNVKLTNRNIACYQGDCSVLLQTLVQDVIFLDPPWGGKGYAKEKTVRLRLNGVDVSEFVRKLKGRAKYVALKVPFNFDLVSFKKGVGMQVEEHRQFHKMMLLVVTSDADTRIAYQHEQAIEDNCA